MVVYFCYSGKGERFSTNDASRDGPYKPPERNQHNAGALRPAEHAPGTSGPPERVPETSRPAEHVPETTRPAKRAPVTSRAAEHNPSASRPARPEPALASKLGNSRTCIVLLQCSLQPVA